MPEIKDLPYLVRLLEDDNPVVRDAVKDALAGFGDGLYDDLRSANIVLEAAQKDLIEALRAGVLPDEGFATEWQNWATRIVEGESTLEEGMGLLSRAIRGDRGAVDALGESLAGLATEYQDLLAERDHVPAVHSLSEFLFKDLGFRGDDGDYYLPRNSDLVSVIERRKGNPISLACIFLLVGDRAGLEIGACNFPGHFMARVVVEEQIFLVDCFNGGRFVPAEDLRNKLANASAFIDDEPSPGAIVRRVLMNLVNAYTQIGEIGRADDFKRLVDSVGA